MGNRLAPLPLILIILALAGCTAAGGTTPSAASTIPASASPTPGASMVPSAQAETPTLTPMSIATPTPTFQVMLMAVGDIMLARSVGDQLLAQGPQAVFAGVQSALETADIRAGNLECAITDRDTPERKSFPLKAPPQAVEALSLAKFDLLSLANNHAMDYGVSGLADTQASLSQSGIATVGAGSNDSAAHAPVIMEKNGLRLAFLAYADVMPENSGFNAQTWIATQSQPGIAWADPARIKADVIAAKLQADLVVVLLHSGFEIGTYVPAISANQREEAHTAIDAGAALVIGSHPHVVEQIERYHGGLIAYSLGNFVFDQYKGIADATIILRVVLDRSGFKSYDYVPVLIENGLPVITSIEHVRGIETLVAP